MAWSARINRTPARDRSAPWGGGEVAVTAEAGKPVEGRDLSSKQTQQVVRIWRLGNLSTPKTVQKLQKRLHAKAKAEAGYRFYALYDKISVRTSGLCVFAQRAQQGRMGVGARCVSSARRGSVRVAPCKRVEGLPSAMTAAAKPSKQPRTESCVASGNAGCEA